METAASLNELMSKVGALMLHWSWLEQGLRSSLEDLRRQTGRSAERTAGTFNERLTAWHELSSLAHEAPEKRELAKAACDQAAELRRIRNHVVHGLQSADARPENGRPTICCLVGGHDDPAAGTVTYTIDDLEHFAQAMDACRRAFVSVDHFNYRL